MPLTKIFFSENENNVLPKQLEMTTNYKESKFFESSLIVETLQRNIINEIVESHQKLQLEMADLKSELNSK